MPLVEYKQCRFSKKGRDDKVAFIPSIHAQVGKILKLRDNDNWDNGWRVESVGKPVALSHTQIERDKHRYWRAQTDI